MYMYRRMATNQLYCYDKPVKLLRQISYIVTTNQLVDKLTSLFILQPKDHRPMWYIYTITGEHRYKHRYNLYCYDKPVILLRQTSYIVTTNQLTCYDKPVILLRQTS